MTVFMVFYVLLDLLYQFNLCKIMLIFYMVTISLSGCVINFLGQVVSAPPLLLQAFQFGKMAHANPVSRLLAALEVPRSWFVHFYVSACMMVTLALALMCHVYVSGGSLPPWAAAALDVLTTPHRTQAASATSAALALCLLALQIYRRLYENLFVSVFSSGHMNVFHYIVGHTHYLGAVALLLSQAPGFSPDSTIVFSGLEGHHIAGTVLFLFGFVVQHRSLCLLASLRSNRGKKMQEKYLMPEGGLFEVVSCPHMLAEVVVYAGLLTVLGTHCDWLWVALWVLSNQHDGTAVVLSEAWCGLGFSMMAQQSCSARLGVAWGLA
ncbi:Polyprenol reductase [Chionoecetes opilio]|uniref:Polyprenal reductase n=1 Tax=Chionoecetes opilio TaxID=41210 RepID=A0A8J4XPH0_CHIOP|nr:Polyprenol reductase [Chionoecetes opilio]